MAQNFFRYVPNFEYISRLPNENSIGDYVQVKNLFKRVKLRPEIFSDGTYFQRYRVLDGERPDFIADKVYGDSKYDWVILLSNNMINWETEWPLTQDGFYNYTISKYGSEQNVFETHHYETREVRNYANKVVCPKGLEVPQNFSFVFFDPNTNEERVATNITDEITNYMYEERLQDKKRQIYVLKPKYLPLVIDDMENLLPYKPGSSQYVSRMLVKGEDSRLFT